MKNLFLIPAIVMTLSAQSSDWVKVGGDKINTVYVNMNPKYTFKKQGSLWKATYKMNRSNGSFVVFIGEFNVKNGMWRNITASMYSKSGQILMSDPINYNAAWEEPIPDSVADAVTDFLKTK